MNQSSIEKSFKKPSPGSAALNSSVRKCMDRPYLFHTTFRFNLGDDEKHDWTVKGQLSPLRTNADCVIERCPCTEFGDSPRVHIAIGESSPYIHSPPVYTQKSANPNYTKRNFHSLSKKKRTTKPT